MTRTDQQAEMFANRLRKNARKLRHWVNRECVTCYRLYDRDIPEIPLVVDWYDGRLHVAEYARRSNDSMENSDKEQWLRKVISSATTVMDVAEDQVFLKLRQRQRGLNQYQRVDQKNARFVVTEAGHRFQVNLSDYIDTGLFLDHRKTRARVKTEAEGKDFLNLFAYTGTFSIYAATGGARTTTTVDISKTYLDWAGHNFRLNGIISDSQKHRLIRDDTQNFLAAAVERSEKYDLIVVDPPTFSNSKRMEGVFDVQKHHPQLLHALLRVLKPRGVIYFSTNFRRFKLDKESLPNLEIKDISQETIPPDFRNNKIHLCFRMTRRSKRVVLPSHKGQI